MTKSQLLYNYVQRIQTLGLKERKYEFSDGFGSSNAYYKLLEWLQIIKEEITQPVVSNAYKPTICLKSGKKYNCPEGHGTIFAPTRCNLPRYCVVCGNSYTNSRVMDSLRLFNMISEKITDLYLIDVVFTLPESIQSKITHSNFKIFQELCKLVLTWLYEGSEVAGFQTCHTWHSMNPVSGWYPHIHSFWLNVGLDKTTGEFEPVPYFVDVRYLNFIYHEILVMFFGEDNVPENVNLHIQYTKFTDKTRGSVFHDLKYALRMYQIDLVRFSDCYEISEYTEDERKNIIMHLIPPKYWKRTQWFGWLSDGCRKKNLDFLDIHNFTMKEKKDYNDEIKCPVCGSVCDFVEYSTISQIKEECEHFHYPLSDYFRDS